MARLIIVIGANGAGKSTWCRANRQELPSDFYDADSIAQGLGSYDDPALQRQAREWVDHRIEGHLECGESFGFESTYSGASRPDIVRRARTLGYAIDAVFVGTQSVDINIDRVTFRVRHRTGHDVPTREIVRRWAAAQENLARTAPFFDNILLLDNSGLRALVVAQVAGQEIVRHTDLLPRWAADLIAKIEHGHAGQAEVPSESSLSNGPDCLISIQ